jgi:hypothetical protein
MTRARRIKLAAISSVGATTSVVTLGIHEQAEGQKATIKVYPLYGKWLLQEGTLAGPQSSTPANKLKDTTANYSW